MIRASDRSRDSTQLDGFTPFRLLLSGVFALIASAALAAELVMVEQPGCVYCAEWNATLGPIYPKTPEGKYAPLVHLQKAALNESGIAFVRPVVYTPTFVLVQDDAEIGRIEGYPGEDFFWAMLGLMLQAKTDFDPGSDTGG
jgi:hypothetical protein